MASVSGVAWFQELTIFWPACAFSGERDYSLLLFECFVNSYRRFVIQIEEGTHFVCSVGCFITKVYRKEST
ncbi:hypothetical protein VIBNISFn135_790029 [Vibrio nigripulchritudo SFn135]|nr:hypothetical protein VIBNISFn135_790029 [Vibrio nigripulchritudo SFn135]